MPDLITAKYVKTQIEHPQLHHPGMALPFVRMNPDKTFGDPQIHLKWQCFTKAGTVAEEHHCHDYDQYLTFLGGDPTKMLDLNGEVEMVLSEDGVNRETHTFTQATTIHIPKGLYHCPLVIKRVDKPIIFVEFFLGLEYIRK
jgi:hypothetical protein